MTGVVIVDDHFPTVGTGFRIAEFSWLLRHGTVDRVATTSPNLEASLPAYSAQEPRVWERVEAFDDASLDGASLAYLVFLNTVDHHLDELERRRVPFVLELYPGGGLYLGDADVERRLDRVLASEMLRHVITTQPIVTERVARSVREGVGVTEIPGVVVDPLYLSPGAGRRSAYFGSGKEVLDVAFVAHRYTRDGADKGLPVFLGVVDRLRDAGVDVVAHLVGGHAADDLGDRDPAGFRLHGVLPAIGLRSVLLGVDVVVSPVRADVLAPGSFDGFPTGSTIEAMLCGALAVTADPRAQNRDFRDGRDIVLEPADEDAIAARLLRISRREGELERIARSGLATARRRHSVAAQLVPRRRILEAERRAVDALVAGD
ncbi:MULTISPECIES: glycosyltransferase [unclassified Agrococcus]|uniref:glycosyltransferase n=1 Tax=unclassified Agrococcus TaxID=2615065 RepID=UPI0036144FC3